MLAVTIEPPMIDQYVKIISLQECQKNESRIFEGVRMLTLHALYGKYRKCIISLCTSKKEQYVSVNESRKIAHQFFSWNEDNYHNPYCHSCNNKKRFTTARR